MSLWEYDACLEGWQRANGGEDESSEPLPEFSEFRAVMSRPKPGTIDQLFSALPETGG